MAAEMEMEEMLERIHEWSKEEWSEKSDSPEGTNRRSPFRHSVPN
jgi:hypothetical protein